MLRSAPKGSGQNVSGIVTDPDTQQRVVPESRRADGSVRKERRVKPGFTPNEDVALFRPSRVLQQQGGRPGAAAAPRILPSSSGSTSGTTIQASLGEPSTSKWNNGRGATPTPGQPRGEAIGHRSLEGSQRRGASESDNWRARPVGGVRQPESGERMAGRQVRRTQKAEEVPDLWDSDSQGAMEKPPGAHKTSETLTGSSRGQTTSPKRAAKAEAVHGETPRQTSEDQREGGSEERPSSQVSAEGKQRPGPPPDDGATREHGVNGAKTTSEIDDLTAQLSEKMTVARPEQ
ncbi:unnamed protein product [Parajaminaea phylloscopi]